MLGERKSGAAGRYLPMDLVLTLLTRSCVHLSKLAQSSLRYLTATSRRDDKLRSARRYKSHRCHYPRYPMFERDWHDGSPGALNDTDVARE